MDANFDKITSKIKLSINELQNKLKNVENVYNNRKKEIKENKELCDNHLQSTKNTLQIITENLLNEKYSNIRECNIINIIQSTKHLNNKPEFINISTILNFELKEENKEIDNQKRENNLTMFQKYFINEFKMYKQWTNRYFENIRNNDCDDIDIFIYLDRNTLRNDFEIKLCHISSFMNKINSIKEDREIWIEYLKTLNLYCHLNAFNDRGIYTFNEFYKEIKNVNTLNHFIGNMYNSNKIFKNTPKYLQNKDKNEGNDDTGNFVR